MLNLNLPPRAQDFVKRFAAICQADERVVAAFLGGSYARGTADAFSDLDLYLITTDAAHTGFVAECEVFLKQLGELVFLEDFDLTDIVFYIFADGTEGELGIGRESQFTHIHSGPYQLLLDKTGILTKVVFSEHQTAPAEQTEKVRRQIYGFWHELSHFITAFGRGQWWWAAGQLEALRAGCVNLARLRHNPAEAEAGDEPYFKLEKAMPVEGLSALRATFGPLEPNALFHAVQVTLRFYQELARALAQTHGLTYPVKLEHVMVERLKKLAPERGA